MPAGHSARRYSERQRRGMPTIGNDEVEVAGSDGARRGSQARGEGQGRQSLLIPTPFRARVWRWGGSQPAPRRRYAGTVKLTFRNGTYVVSSIPV
jgi:hypothetical protein